MERWQNDQRGGKLTREARADLLGVSVATAGRILAGSGVDRATLALAFKNLCLSWDDSCCERIDDETEGIESALSTPPPDPIEVVVPAKAFVPAKGARNYAIGAAFLSLALTAFLLLRPSPSQSEAWLGPFNDAIAEGTTRYHRGDYAGGKAPYEKALRFARQHDSAGRLSNALRLGGDLAEAQGHLREARDLYRESLIYRERLQQDLLEPPMYEALGDVQTRLGEFGEAKDSLIKSLNGYRHFNDRMGVSMASRDLGSVAFRVGNHDAAERWFKASLEALGGVPNPDMEADVKDRQALLDLKRGRVSKARKAMRDCLDHWTSKGHPRWIALSQLHLGMAESQLGNDAVASVLISRSKAGFERLGDLARAHEAGSHLARFASR